MIYYGGIELSNLTARLPHVAEHISRFISPADMREFYRPSWPIGLSSTQSFNVPADDYPYHPIKLDSLFWPVGASSWAVGHYLVADATLAQIRTQAYQGGTFHSLPLVIKDGLGNTLTTSLWMLPARPLAQIQGCEGLSLLTLVDERYYWWDLPFVQLDIGPSTTWVQVLAILNAIKAFSHDPILPAYLDPATELHGLFNRFPPVLDTVAYSLGMRVVRKLDGTVALVNAVNSRIKFETNFSLYKGRVAGGRFNLDLGASADLTSELPTSVKVSFPPINATGPDAWTESATLASLALPEFAGITGNGNSRQFADTKPADFEGGLATPNNHAQLLTLTRQFATDYYRWRTPGLDLVLGGCVPWDGEAHSAMTEWVHSLSGAKIYTRLQRGSDTAVQLYHGPDGDDLNKPPTTNQGKNLFVRMLRDAVQKNHPEYIPLSLTDNAIVQKKNLITGDWQDTTFTLFVNTIDGLNSNGRLPLRKDDRFWVMQTPQNQWVPTQSPRQADVRVTADLPTLVGFPGTLVYKGFLRLLEVLTMQDQDGNEVRVFDGNGIGLEPGVYQAGLAEHRDGFCLYRATCCVGGGSFAAGSISGSLSGSDSGSGPSPCLCVPVACAPCLAGTISQVIKLVIFTSCPEFSGQFLLYWNGDCTWRTTTYVSQIFQGGNYGPTWELRLVGGVWHLLAAGTDLGSISQPRPITGSFVGNCNSQIIFGPKPILGWVYGKGHSCVITGGPDTSQVCPCPGPEWYCTLELGCALFSVSDLATFIANGGHVISGPYTTQAQCLQNCLGGSLPGSLPPCPVICDLCTVTHCEFSVDLSGFSDQVDCINCLKTPVTWSADIPVGEFADCASALEGVWTFSPQPNQQCGWYENRGNSVGTFGIGGNVITMTLTAGIGGNTASAVYQGIISQQDCCVPTVLSKVSVLCNGGPVKGPDLITVTPFCSPDPPPSFCDAFNLGLVTIPNFGNCYWQTVQNGVTITLLFDGTSWELDLSGPGGISAVYRTQGDMNCCGNHTIYLESTNCVNAPDTLPLTALGNCDNCCSGSGGGSAGSGGNVGPNTCCPNGFPATLFATISDTEAPYACLEATYKLVFNGVDSWIYSGPAGFCAGDLILRVFCTDGGFDVSNMAIDITTDTGTYGPATACVDLDLCPPGSTCGPPVNLFFLTTIGASYGQMFGTPVTVEVTP